jgi:CHAD domain-containing protein
MPPELTPVLLAAPAARSARILAREHLANVMAEFDRFLTDDAAGFHDLRVALRRLRSCMRAYRRELEDTVRRKTRRGLRKLAHATSPARDAEVMIEWVEQQPGAGSRERVGARYLVESLVAERDEWNVGARAKIERKLPKLAAALSNELRWYSERNDIEDPTPPPSMARVTHDTIIAHAERVARAIDRIESADDAEAIHRARIAAKRLRYLLEPIADPVAAALVERLTALQDTLGTCHDMHGLVNRIVRELGEIGARDAHMEARRAILDDDASSGQTRLATHRPGLNALGSRAREAEVNAFDAFRAAWSPTDVARMMADVERVVTPFSSS